MACPKICPASLLEGKVVGGAGETAQWLRTLDVLPQDLRSVPSQHPHGGSQSSLVPRDLKYFLASVGTACGHTHTHTHTHTHICGKCSHFFSPEDFPTEPRMTPNAVP